MQSGASSLRGILGGFPEKTPSSLPSAWLSYGCLPGDCKQNTLYTQQYVTWTDCHILWLVIPYSINLTIHLVSRWAKHKCWKTKILYLSGISCIVAGIRTSVRTWKMDSTTCPVEVGVLQQLMRMLLYDSGETTTLYSIESHTQKMSTIMVFSSRGKRWSGIPCQKCIRKFCIWNIVNRVRRQFVRRGYNILCLVLVWNTSSKLTLMALSRMHWQCVLYIMMSVSTYGT